jgi:uncharacterized oligopeptide transporter (OPT) family protein
LSSMIFPKGAILQRPQDHPRAIEPVVLALTVALSVLGAVIGLHLVTTLGITANTAVIGALVAMLTGRIPLAALRKMRSVHRQNLVQSAISGATFAAANSLLVPIAVPFALGRPDLVWPMLAGATVGLVVDSWVLFRVFDSKLYPARNAWPPGVAAAETIIAGDEGGRRAGILAGGAVIGVLGTIVKLPMSAAGVALIGNVWALLMFGVGLFVTQYVPGWTGVDLDAAYIPHGVMIGAGVVALLQAIWLLARREQADPRADHEPADASAHITVDEAGLRRGILEGYILFTLGAVLVGVIGGVLGDLSAGQVVLWVLFAGFAALVHELIVGLAAMHSGWFPAFAVTLIFLILGLILGFPAVPLTMLVAYCASTGPAFADMGYDFKAGWILRQGSTPHTLVERYGRKQQYIAQLFGFAVALAVVAYAWQTYFTEGRIPPVSEVYAETIQAGISDTSALVNLLLWAVPGAIIQAVGGPARQMGVLLATGLLILSPNACWLVFGALAVRMVWTRLRPEAASELALVGAGIIAGNSLYDTTRILQR